MNKHNAKHLKKKGKWRINASSVASYGGIFQDDRIFCMSEDEKKEIEPIFTEYCF